MATAGVSFAQATFTTLADFDGPFGEFPYYESLVQGTDGMLYGTASSAGANSGGTVFKVTTAGTQFAVYNFCSLASCADGSSPTAGLVLASSGNVYGTTELGGTGLSCSGSMGCGTVFEMTPSGKLTTLHSFNGTDGFQPFAPLMQASNGNFYGTTTFGGTNTNASCGSDGCGTVFEITPQGNFTTLHSFNSSDGQWPIGGLVQATNGNFYGTTQDGGAFGLGTIFEITVGGKLTTLHSFNITDGAYPNDALVQTANGIFYGTTSAGGLNSGGTVFEMTAAGKFATLYSFCSQAGCADGSSPNAGLIQATDGNLYGTTSQGAINNNGTAFKITQSGTLTTLHSFCSQLGCPDGTALFGGLLQDTNGTFYGTTDQGGAGRSAGTFFSIATGLGPFVKTLPTAARVGAKVIILATNLTGATSVSFNGTASTFTVASSSEIATKMPAGATTGSVKVTTPGGTLASNVIFRVTPQITSFTPASGPVGTSVQITGVSLTQTSRVTFGGVAATSFAVNSDTQVTATVPTGAKTGKTSITTKGGTATSAGSFIVTP